jgi:hypothetical protein
MKSFIWENEMLKQACPEEILNQVQNDTFGVQHDREHHDMSFRALP